MKGKYFIFDLDDTLVPEIDYLQSAYKEIALSLADEQLFDRMFNWYQEGQDVFNLVAKLYSISKEDLLQKYRCHYPVIQLTHGALEVLQEVKRKGHLLGLITDGRSITQRNKLKALGIENYFDKIIISEEFGSTKPSKRNFEVFENASIADYFYIGDNVTKDFLTPNVLGWNSICLLDQGKNIHKQDFSVSEEFLPQYKITSLIELLEFLK